MEATRLATKRQAAKALHLPGVEHTCYHQSELCEVYFYASRRGQPLCAIAWTGKAAKPAFNYAFPNEARRKDYCDNYLTNIEAHSVQVAARRIRIGHTLKVGDILYSSWGYDQTNIEFYQVTGLKGRGILIKQLKASQVETGFMCGNIDPIPGEFVSDMKTYHIPHDDNTIKVDPCAYLRNQPDCSAYRHQYAWPWDGKTKHNSWYA